jgi:hypothetical protein
MVLGSSVSLLSPAARARLGEKLSRMGISVAGAQQVLGGQPVTSPTDRARIAILLGEVLEAPQFQNIKFSNNIHSSG